MSVAVVMRGPKKLNLEDEVLNTGLVLMGIGVLNHNELLTLERFGDGRDPQTESEFWRKGFNTDIVENPQVPKANGQLPEYFYRGNQRNCNQTRGNRPEYLAAVAFYEAKQQPAREP